MPRSRSELVSLLAPLAAGVLLILLVQPWGNYPLNDDWIYARIGKRFAETGRFVFDHDTGAAFIGQGFLAAPVIRLLGFSHTHLRSLTMVFAGLIVCLLWLLLRNAGVRPAVRAVALLAVVCNPLFAYLSLSFMTEIYGYLVVLLGAVIWLRDRRAHPEGVLVSWFGAIATALAVGFGFWIRQYSVLVFPALLGAVLPTGWPRLRQSAPRLAVSCVVFAGTIAAYFFFIRHMAEVPLLDFSNRLARIWPINIGAAFLQSGIFLAYMTAFLLPLLLLVLRPWSRKMLPLACLLGALGFWSALVLLHMPPHLDVHTHFPYLGNIIRNAGVGPILLPDIQFLQMRSPAWPVPAWGAIECVILAASLLWVPVIFTAPAILRQRGPRAELLLFALLFSLASITATTLVDRLAIFDRYYLPETFGLALALAVILSDAPRLSVARFGVALLPMAFFTVAGLHDYFRWSDAGWELYGQALRSGATPANIESSYEMNGWNAFTIFQSNTGPIHCDSEWFCLDDTYRIGMNVYGNYEVVSQRQPSYWLTSGPPVVLSRRRPISPP
jgi:hypothetical protein